MDRAVPEVSNDAAASQRDVRERSVVRKHRDDRLAVARIGNTGRLVRTQLEKRATLPGAAVEHGYIVPGLQ